MKDNRTYGDRRKYLIRALIKRRKKVRLNAIKHLGGKMYKMWISKYPEVLEFHHKDPNKKGFGISRKGHCRSWDSKERNRKMPPIMCKLP